MIEFRMPSLGADMEAGFLREWRVKPGDQIKHGDIIAEVETQKGIIEIEAFDDGIVGELLAKVDDKVPVGTLMTHILAPGETDLHPADREPVISEENGQPAEEKTKEMVKEYEYSGEELSVHHVRASPLARKVAAEKGLDISILKGSGPEGAIVRDDVEKALIERISPTEPSIATPGKPSGQEVPVAEEPRLFKPAYKDIRMAVAAAMERSNREIPHYYLQTKMDMSHTLNWLAEENKARDVRKRVLPVVLMIKAVAKALEEVPDLNSWWVNGLQRKEEINIGFVISLRTGGIVVPAIHEAGQKTVEELMNILSDIITRARSGKLRSSELTSTTITVSSLGEGGTETMFGVIYPPQVALVAFGSIIEEAWAENGMVGPRPVLTTSLAADHRATDGVTGSRFLTSFKRYLSNPGEL